MPRLLKGRTATLWEFTLRQGLDSCCFMLIVSVTQGGYIILHFRNEEPL